jgi:hypothetical protein
VKTSTGSFYQWGLTGVTGTTGANLTPNATGGTSSTWDLLSITGLALGGTGDVTIKPMFLPTTNLASGSVAAGTTWDIIHLNTPATANYVAMFKLDPTTLATFATDVGSNPGYASSNFQLVADGNDIAIQVNTAPEPTSMMLLGLGVGGLAMRRRRRAVKEDSSK